MKTWNPAEIRQANRRSWNEATAAHNRQKKDQATFFREGGSTLFPEERALLGDISGKSVVHLMCNSGQDTLSIARLGARMKGVDISDEAISFARALSEQTGIPAQFERDDVYDWLQHVATGEDRFDVVFCSYGALCWLPDLEAFAHGVASILADGGRFVCVDFHPYATVFSEQWELTYPYGGAAGVIAVDTGVGDYVADSGASLAPSGRAEDEEEFVNPHPSYEFNWGIGEILSALIGAGLTVRHFGEYPFANGWKGFDRMRALPGERWAPPADQPEIPLMFSVTASKAEASHSF